MADFVLPPSWSAPKFAARYGLNPDTDFYITGEGLLRVFPTLPDNPPIFDLPDPPQPQGELRWEPSEVPGTLRLVALFNGKKSAIVGAVGADASQAAMYQSPGPVGPLPAGPRREYHVATVADIGQIPTTVVDGDTLYIEADGEYRFTHGVWRRVLTGPVLGTPADTDPLFAGLTAALDAAMEGVGPPVNPKILAVFAEMKKVFVN